MPNDYLPPSDYGDALQAALYNWTYLLTYLFPAAVYAVPAVRRWRGLLWLIPVAFAASCAGYFVYWRSIEYALTAYYQKTGYLDTADTWYVFMLVFRGLPNSITATFVCSLLAWRISRRRIPDRRTPTKTLADSEVTPAGNQSDNPYQPPRFIDRD